MPRFSANLSRLHGVHDRCRGVRAALPGGLGDSTTLKVHGERMVDETFGAGFRLRLLREDMSLAVDAARALDRALPSATVRQLTTIPP